MAWAWGSGLWASAGGRAGRSLRPKVVGKARLAVLVHHQEEMDHGRPHADESAPASRGSRDFLLRGSAKVARGGARGAGLAAWSGAVRTEGRGGRGEGHKRSPLARRCRRSKMQAELVSAFLVPCAAGTGRSKVFAYPSDCSSDLPPVWVFVRQNSHVEGVTLPGNPSW